jgi:hypothetical protein
MTAPTPQPPRGLSERILALKREIMLMQAKEARIRDAIRMRQHTLCRLEASHAMSEASRQSTARNE